MYRLEQYLLVSTLQSKLRVGIFYKSERTYYVPVEYQYNLPLLSFICHMYRSILITRVGITV